MPHRVNVRCPKCGLCAVFEFAEVVRIELKKDVAFFQKSSLFDYRKLKDSCGHRWHAALYYPGLHGGVDAIGALPDGYKPDDWSHSKYLYRSHGLDIGSIYCQGCHLRTKHELSWPEEAFFSIQYQNKHLWAFDRESAVQLKDFIASNNRNVESFKRQCFLLHIPSEFKQKRAREYIIKQLDRLIKGHKL